MPTVIDWRSAIRSKMKNNATILISDSDKSESGGDTSNANMPGSQDSPSTSSPPKSAGKQELKKERILTDADWIGSLEEKELKWIKKHAK